MTTKKVKEITPEQYLALLELGIPAVAYSPSRIRDSASALSSIRMNLIDMMNNTWRIDFEREWTTKPGSFFILCPDKLVYFTLVSQEEADAT